MSFDFIRYLAFVSVIIYFIFDFLDGKRIKDEREEFIRLKTFELIHKVSLTALTLLSLSLALYPELPGSIAVMIFVFSFMYAEIFGKLYFRSKY